MQAADEANASAIEIAKAYLEGEIKKNAEAISALKTSVAALETSVRDMLSKHDADLAAVRLTIENNLKAMTDAIDALKTAQAATDKAQDDKIEALKVLVAELNGRVTLAEGKVADFGTALDGLTAEVIADRAALAAYQEATDAVLEDLKNRIATLENADLINRMDVVEGILGDDIKAALEQAGFADVEALVYGFIELDGAHAALKEAFEAHKAAIDARVEALEAQLAKDIQDLQNAMVEGDGAVKEELLAVIRALNEAMETADQELRDQLQSEVENLAQAIADGDTEMRTYVDSRLANTHEAMEQADAVLATRIEALEEEIAFISQSLREINDKVTANYNQFVAKFAELTETIGTLREDVNSNMDRINLMDTDIVGLQKRMAMTEEGITELNAAVQTIQTDLADLTTKVNDIEERLQKMEGLKEDIEKALNRIQSIVTVPEYTDGTYDLTTIGADNKVITNFVDLYYTITVADNNSETGIISTIVDAYNGGNTTILALDAVSAKSSRFTRAINAVSAGIVKVWNANGKLAVRATFDTDAAEEAINVALVINGVKDSNVVSDYAGIEYPKAMLPIYLHNGEDAEYKKPWNTKVTNSKVELLENANFTLKFGDVELGLAEFAKEYGVTLGDVKFRKQVVANIDGTETNSYSDVFKVVLPSDIGIAATYGEDGKVVIKNEVMSIAFAGTDEAAKVTQENVNDYVNVAVDYFVDIEGSNGEATASTSYIDYRYTIVNTFGGTFYFNATNSPVPGANVKAWGEEHTGLDTHYIYFPWNYAWLMDQQVEGEQPVAKPAINAIDLVGNETGEIKVEFVPSEDINVTENQIDYALFKEIIKQKNLSAADKSEPVKFSAVASNAAYIVKPSFKQNGYEWGETYNVEYTYTYDDVEYKLVGTIELGELPADIDYEGTFDVAWAEHNYATVTLASRYDAETTGLGFADQAEFVTALGEALSDVANVAERSIYHDTTVDNHNCDDSILGLELNDAKTAIVGDVQRGAILTADDKYVLTYEATTWYGQTVTIEMTSNAIELPTTALGIELNDKWFNSLSEVWVEPSYSTVDYKWVAATREETKDYILKAAGFDQVADANLYFDFDASNNPTNDAQVYPTVKDRVDVSNVSAKIVDLQVLWDLDAMNQRTVNVVAYAALEGTETIVMSESALPFTVNTYKPIEAEDFAVEHTTTVYTVNADGSKSVNYNLFETMSIVDYLGTEWINAPTPNGAKTAKNFNATKFGEGGKTFGYVFRKNETLLSDYEMNVNGVCFAIDSKDQLENLKLVRGENGEMFLNYVVKAGGSELDKPVVVKVKAAIDYFLADAPIEREFTVTINAPAEE